MHDHDHNYGHDRVEGLLARLTLPEKVSLLAGADFWSTVAVERLGIPSIKVTDGPNGARGGEGFGDGPPSACFPAEIALAASWNVGLVAEIGQALAQEARTKGASVLLAPTVNIHRSPLNGRNFECFSEDPYLAARLAVAYIQGVQGEGVGATVKHFVCNDSEFERNSISSEVRERPLREIYLAPFLAAVKEARVWAVMSAYNRVNGAYASENRALLVDTLKGEWGFDGLVMSDWTGTYSTADAANNGLDLEMPGPARWRGNKLLAAVEDGAVAAEAIDDSARRLLRLLTRVGAFDRMPETPHADDRPEHRAVARAAATEGIVLLKNEHGALPLDRTTRPRIAVIGPNAREARIMGGGSAQVNAQYAVAPYDGIVAAAGEGATVRFEQGCTNHKRLPLLDMAWIAPASDGASDGQLRQGFGATYWNNADLSGEPVATGYLDRADQFWMGTVVPGVDPFGFSARFSGRLMVPASAANGRYAVSLVSAGLCRLLVDGRQTIDNWGARQRGDSYFGFGSTEVIAPVDLEAGHSYDVALEFAKDATAPFPVAAFRMGLLPPRPADAIDRAVALAAASDVAIVCAGTSGEWESEGHDRPGLGLPGQQDDLIARVAEANPRTVVVLNVGSPLTMPWLDRVAAVLVAWFPGQECGHAIADVLFGDATPSGKLPQTFPRRLEDNPAYLNYPGENGKVSYGEGLYVGYRYYDKKGIAPLFPFGFGLSYTSFAYANPRLSAMEIGPHDTLLVQIDITNEGGRAGQEVVQVYVRDREARLGRPDKELKAFAKVALGAGETQTVSLPLARDAWSYYDDATHAWVAEPGLFDILVGASAADIRVQAAVTLTP